MCFPTAKAAQSTTVGLYPAFCPLLKSSSAFTMGCGASARVSAHVGHRLSFRHPSDEKRPQAGWDQKCHQESCKICKRVVGFWKLKGLEGLERCPCSVASPHQAKEGNFSGNSLNTQDVTSFAMYRDAHMTSSVGLRVPVSGGEVSTVSAACSSGLEGDAAVAQA